MPTYKNILIGLENTTFDRTLIQYTDFISRVYDVENVTFFHANIDSRMKRLLHQLACTPATNREEIIINNMLEMVQKHFSSVDKMRLNVIAIERDSIQDIIEIVDNHNIDLLVLGKKKNERSFSSFSATLARKVPCPVLLVPENAKAQINKIMVPVDFSDNAAKALEAAIYLDKYLDTLQINVNEDVKVQVNHVYAPPPSELVDAMTNEQLKAQLFEVLDAELDDAYQQFMTLINDSEPDIERYFTPNINFAGAEITYTLAKDLNCNLIVCGATGKSNFDRFLMGSFTEKLMLYNDSIPLLIVK